MELAGYSLRHGVDYKLFAILAALSNKIASVEYVGFLVVYI